MGAGRGQEPVTKIANGQRAGPFHYNVTSRAARGTALGVRIDRTDARVRLVD